MSQHASENQKKGLTQRETVAFLEKMRVFHRECIKAKANVSPYGDFYDMLEEILRRLDNTAELLTGDRRFLYTATDGQPLELRHEKVSR